MVEEIGRYRFMVELENYPTCVEAAVYREHIARGAREEIQEKIFKLPLHESCLVRVSGGRVLDDDSVAPHVYGIAEALVAINNTLHKYGNVLHPVHEYQLKQAIEALGTMRDRGLV